ncbi:DUF3311 domain-containing protein [Streptomyces verrucosisporus]|uniref:DUF3311 domain-containing protein n=1 Tax=Streptomyces verrucosisporus TaxID=1695161 RepID=UPI0019CF996B|nr:DUF3311 domain-containing protein [Streptomyces verrucosisporus]MBN3932196.1 DUF3311 domain-containing protein [Streptomyces verrucosisporus]
MPVPPKTPGPLPVVTPARVAIGACLLAPFAAMLWVGSYARAEPVLAGIPFFYWYQLLWVPLSAALMAVAHVLVRRDRAARRTAERGGAGQTAGDGER